MISEDVSYSPPSDYEIRKQMLEVMSDQDINSLIWNKKREASAIRVPKDSKLTEQLLAISDWLKLPYEMVHNTYLEELRRDCNDIIDLMEIETRKRRSPEWQVDLAELKASVPIDAVVRYYIPWVKTTKANIRCPFHEERSGSLHIYHQTNTFKCFGCWAWGTQIDWIMRSDKCDIKTAINKLKSFT